MRETGSARALARFQNTPFSTQPPTHSTDFPPAYPALARPCRVGTHWVLQQGTGLSLSGSAKASVLHPGLANLEETASGPAPHLTVHKGSRVCSAFGY